MKNNKKKIIISIGLIVVFILAMVGISYAAFQFVGQGNKVNQITTGTISMNYEEGTNVIRLNNALPTTDATGKVRLTEGEYFDFSVTTNITGDVVINWEIASVDFDDNTFNGSNVKFYLTKLVDGIEEEVSDSLPAVYSENTEENKKTGRPANMMSLLTGSTSTQGEETVSYRLRLYVDENYNPQGDGGGLVFKTRINVYGKVSTEIEPIMRTFVTEEYVDGDNYTQVRVSDDFGSYLYKEKVTSVITKNNTLVPETAIEIENGKGNYWDESEARDDSVIAYIEDDGSGNGTYKVTIGGKGEIIVQDLIYAFQEFKYLKSVDLSHLDTSNVINMHDMFSRCSSLTDLNLSNFNTSNVTYIFSMFSGCSSLTSLNLSNFNTSNVTTMDRMFSGCSSLTNLNLNNFNTSNVTTMREMFSGCSSLTNLNLNNFNTSNVTTMREMFSGCSSLTSLNLSNFNTSNVTDMRYMFSECSSLTNLNLSSFDTSNVTNMNSMFYNCSSLTSLNLSNFNTSNVTYMHNMFSGCSSLANITVSNLWTEEKVTNKYGMFDNCGTDHVTVV